MTSSIESQFVLFGTDHLTTMLLIAATSVALPMAMRQVEQQRRERLFAIFLGAALVIHEFVKIGTRVWVYDMPLVQHLPLHLCGAATFLVAYVLARRSYTAFEVAYFWMMGGTLQAIATPDLKHGFPSIMYLTFFLGHGLVVLGVVYAIVVYEFRPTLRSVARTAVVTLCYMAVVGCLNVALGTNYLYLRYKPVQASLMDYLGPWPWYIFGLVLLGLLSCLIYYLPFAWLEWLSKRRTSARDAG